jgi:peptidyl-prolyl cis-trans isomerase B (cyclophilin B)
MTGILYNETPIHRDNFLKLVGEEYYDGLLFHRVIDGFMIQGGDPLGNGTGGESIFGECFATEHSPELTHKYGALSMANRGGDTNGSQFFIVQAKSGTPHLDGKHPVFGQVFNGMDVVDKIAKVDVDYYDRPEEPVIIEKINIVKYPEIGDNDA